MAVARKEISAVLGPTDDDLAAGIAAMDVSREELAEAFVWLNSEEALLNEGRSLPAGKIGELIGILSPPADDDAPVS